MSCCFRLVSQRDLNNLSHLFPPPPLPFPPPLQQGILEGGGGEEDKEAFNHRRRHRLFPPPRCHRHLLRFGAGFSLFSREMAHSVRKRFSSSSSSSSALIFSLLRSWICTLVPSAQGRSRRSRSVRFHFRFGRPIFFLLWESQAFAYNRSHYSYPRPHLHFLKTGGGRAAAVTFAERNEVGKIVDFFFFANVGTGLFLRRCLFTCPCNWSISLSPSKLRLLLRDEMCEGGRGKIRQTGGEGEKTPNVCGKPA